MPGLKRELQTGFDEIFVVKPMIKNGFIFDVAILNVQHPRGMNDPFKLDVKLILDILFWITIKRRFKNICLGIGFFHPI